MSYYKKGRGKEYKTIKWLNRRGWLTIRSSRSQTPFDIIAAKNGKLKFIQVKSKPYLSKEEKETITNWKKAFGISKIELWIWRKFAKKPIIKLI